MIVAHELGHAGGLGHDASFAVCAMSDPPNQGPFTNLCPDAITKMRGIYAAGPVYQADATEGRATDVADARALQLGASRERQ